LKHLILLIIYYINNGKNYINNNNKKNTIFNYVIYNDYPSNSAKTIYKGQNCDDYETIIKKIKSIKMRDGGILRNALGEGLATALEVITILLLL